MGGCVGAAGEELGGDLVVGVDAALVAADEVDAGVAGADEAGVGHEVGDGVFV